LQDRSRWVVTGNTGEAAASAADAPPPHCWFCDLLQAHNLLIRQLCHVVDLPCTPATLSVRYAIIDNGETCAIYCSDDIRDVKRGTEEPNLKWRKWLSVDCSVRVEEDEVNVLSFPVLHPEGRGGYRYHELSTTGKQMTRTDHFRHLLFQPPLHMTRCSTVLEAYVLRCLEQIPRSRVLFFYNSASSMQIPHAADIAANPRAQQVGRPSHIPGTFIGRPHSAQHMCDEVMTAATHFGVDNILYVTISLNSRWAVIDELCRAQGLSSGDALFGIYTRVFDAARSKLYARLRSTHYLPQHLKGDSRKCLWILDSNERHKRKLPHAGPPNTAALFGRPMTSTA
jgi:hypothetical protein